MGMTVRRRLSRGRDGTFVDGKIRGRGKTNSVLLCREEFGSATHRVARAAVAMAFAGSRMPRRACLRETARASPRARVCDPGARSSPSRRLLAVLAKPINDEFRTVESGRQAVRRPTSRHKNFLMGRLPSTEELS